MYQDENPNRFAILAKVPKLTAAAESTENLLYLCTVVINVYVASPVPDPSPRGGGNSTLTSGTSGGAAPTYTIYIRGGGQLLNPKSAIVC